MPVLRRVIRNGRVPLAGVAILLSSGEAPAGWAEPVLGTGASVEAPRARAVGTIRGTVDRGRAASQTLDRYAGRTAARAPRPAQAPPAIAFLEGTPGGRTWAPAGSVTLTQADTLFSPAVVVVPVGGTVAFPNEDTFFHNVFSYSDAKRFDLGRYPRGESREVLFDRAGIVQVFCEVHDHMRATILVSANPFHAIVAEDDTFTITGVPAGAHELTVWAPEGERTEPVTVTDGATEVVTVRIE